MIKPLLGLLGDTQAKIATSDETAAADAERISDDDAHALKNPRCCCVSVGEDHPCSECGCTKSNRQRDHPSSEGSNASG
jgi:hypothetical protein